MQTTNRVPTATQQANDNRQFRFPAVFEPEVIKRMNTGTPSLDVTTYKSMDASRKQQRVTTHARPRHVQWLLLTSRASRHQDPDQDGDICHDQDAEADAIHLSAEPLCTSSGTELRE